MTRAATGHRKAALMATVRRRELTVMALRLRRPRRATTAVMARRLGITATATESAGPSSAKRRGGYAGTTASQRSTHNLHHDTERHHNNNQLQLDAKGRG